MKESASPLIRKLTLLMPLTEEERATLARLESVVRRVPARAGLYVQGEPYGRVFVVRGGWAMRSRTLSDGRRQITNFAIPGDILGLYANLLEVADHSAVALTDMEVAEFAPDAITTLFRDHPRLAVAFAWCGAREESILSEKAACLGRRTAVERVAHLLLELLRRLQVVRLAQGDRFLLPVSQEVLADTLGLSVVHINRTLSRLRSEGLIEMDGQTLYLKSVEGLAETADFDDLYLYYRRMPVRMQRQLAAE
ncbi:Crp/Fnr family transcriptional regulator [Azospirillum sp.]|uniref:Crp/Fnr family transcriptional regulator n=1 Tax=Azospirillum sp. TaxID=34012 RepID=UPI003D721155